MSSEPKYMDSRKIASQPTSFSFVSAPESRTFSLNRHDSIFSKQISPCVVDHVRIREIQVCFPGPYFWKRSFRAFCKDYLDLYKLDSSLWSHIETEKLQSVKVHILKIVYYGLTRKGEVKQMDLLKQAFAQTCSSLYLEWSVIDIEEPGPWLVRLYYSSPYFSLLD